MTGSLYTGIITRTTLLIRWFCPGLFNIVPRWCSWSLLRAFLAYEPKFLFSQSPDRHDLDPVTSSIMIPFLGDSSPQNPLNQIRSITENPKYRGSSLGGTNLSVPWSCCYELGWPIAVLRSSRGCDVLTRDDCLSQLTGKKYADTGFPCDEFWLLVSYFLHCLIRFPYFNSSLTYHSNKSSYNLSLKFAYTPCIPPSYDIRHFSPSLPAKVPVLLIFSSHHLPNSITMSIRHHRSKIQIIKNVHTHQQQLN